MSKNVVYWMYKEFMMSYEKTENLLDLAIWMQSNREGISLSDIMNRFQVSRRTAERMRDMIVSRFIQTEEIEGDNRQKRWRIPQGTLKDFIQFSADDLACLNLAKDALEKEKLSDKAVQLNTIIEKITASIKTDTLRKIEPDAEVLLEAQGFARRVGPKIKINTNYLDIIKEAILSTKKITITYKNEKQTVSPYGFLYGNKHYLVAYSDKTKEYRYFALHKLSDVQLTDNIFRKDESFSLEDFTKDCFGVYREEPVEVEWLFNAETADDASKYEFHPSQQMIKNPDGTLTVKFFAGGQKEMDWHLYTWGNKVKVIKPERK